MLLLLGIVIGAIVYYHSRDVVEAVLTGLVVWIVAEVVVALLN